MRRIPGACLFVMVLTGLICPGVLAAPSAKVAVDRQSDGIVLETGSWVDLVVTVDPGSKPVLLDGLEVEANLGPAIETRAAILPPPDAGEAYSRPFEVRIPVRATVPGEVPVRVRVSGELQGGGELATGTQTKLTVFAAMEPADDGGLLPFDESGGPSKVIAAASIRKEPVVAGVPNAVVVEVRVAEDWHVYGKEIEIGLPTTVELLPAGPDQRWSGGRLVTPPGENLHGTFEIEIPFTPLTTGKVESRVALFYMACDANTCDPVRLVYLPISFEVEPGSAEQVAEAAAAGKVEEAQDAEEARDERPTGAAASGDKSGIAAFSMWKLIVGAILAGLLALAMPCTYPMIPITISFFTKQAEARDGKVVGLALAYGAGIVAIFACIGLTVGATTVTGSNVLAFAANWVVNSVFALLFLLFGLSLIGVFEIRLPRWFDDLATKATGAGGLLGVFAMGATLVITSFTCTAPFVGNLLVYASASGDWKKVTFAMAVFGLTMAIPFVFLSLSPKAIQRMPRSGIWMKHLKVTLGILELGLALKFLSAVDIAIQTNLIGRETFLVLWGTSFLVAGLYLFGLFDLFRKGVPWSVTRGRVVAGLIMFAVTGLLAMGLGGKPLPSSDLEAFLPKPPKSGDEVDDYGVGFAAVVKDDLEKGLRVAQEKGKLVFWHHTGYQ